MTVKKPMKKLRSNPTIHPFIDRINDYLEWEQRKIPAAGEIWMRENKCVLECAQFLKEFFSPRRFDSRGCPGGWPQCCVPPIPPSIRARKAKR
jgi:hypothetical protein